MRPSFVIMLAVGLGLMFLFWWKSWQVEGDKVAAEALIVGCATGKASCPADLPVCLTAFDARDGICSAVCAADSQCPGNWCCPLPEAGMTQRLCAPRQICSRLDR